MSVDASRYILHLTLHQVDNEGSRVLVFDDTAAALNVEDHVEVVTEANTSSSRRQTRPMTNGDLVSEAGGLGMSSANCGYIAIEAFRFHLQSNSLMISLMQDQGASPNEQLLNAAKTDNEELLLSVLSLTGRFDINHQDGLGFTALHYAVQRGSTDCLDHILEEDDCDVDLQTRLEGLTPIHLAMQVQDQELRIYLVRSLLEAGSSTQIPNKYRQLPVDLLSPSRPSDVEIIEIMKEQQEEDEARGEEGGIDMFDSGDLAEEDDGPGTGSGSDSD
ncbi:Ankyrin repeat-containing domain [Phaffia rhodozyma]|uniref:Ankyrin repeat-containing domain n=1 Tax=Phaffia rhodozyma TaxID=264483 RepID=A0A0F7SN86_PHARH|nr:Ankyrin repeat-containing domain [Phaffia rhodozyma]